MAALRGTPGSSRGFSRAGNAAGRHAAVGRAQNAGFVRVSGGTSRARRGDPGRSQGDALERRGEVVQRRLRPRGHRRRGVVHRLARPAVAQEVQGGGRVRGGAGAGGRARAEWKGTRADERFSERPRFQRTHRGARALALMSRTTRKKISC